MSDLDEHRAAVAAEWGTWVAAGAIYVDGVRAFNAGQSVPASTVAARGWDTSGEVVRAGEPIPEPAGPVVVTPPQGEPIVITPDPVLSPQVPPKSGKGSSADEWRMYATHRHVDVAEDASRDDIIAAIEAAGFPTE